MLEVGAVVGWVAVGERAESTELVGEAAAKGPSMSIPRLRSFSTRAPVGTCGFRGFGIVSHFDRKEIQPTPGEPGRAELLTLTVPDLLADCQLI